MAAADRAGQAVPALPAGQGEGEAVLAGRLLAEFARRGLHSTRPRRLIAERLAARAGGEVFTADELWRDVQGVERGLGRATVYRALEVLSEAGALDRVPFADGTHRYRLCGGSHHHHLTCSRCHRVVEIDLCLPPEALAAIERRTAFALEGHSLELFGRCLDCRDAP